MGVDAEVSTNSRRVIIIKGKGGSYYYILGSIESEKEMSRVIVDPDNTSVLLSREHVLGYLHALEEFTTGMCSNIINENIELSNEQVAAYHGVIINYLDELRTKAARDLGRLELTNNTIWMDD